MSATMRLFRMRPLAASTLHRVERTRHIALLQHHLLSPIQLSHRYFSDNLLGHSPMAQTSPSSSSSESKMPTAKDVTTAGGVWAPTSAKRDKITELQLALEEGQSTLDDAATPEQLLDLYLADGLDAIVKSVEANQADNIIPIVSKVNTWLDEKAKHLPEDLHQVQWESYLREVSRKAESLASEYPPGRCLRNVRDFVEWKPQEHENEQAPLDTDVAAVDSLFQDCVSRYRLSLLRQEAELLLESWNELTKVSDSDIDRAAVQGESLEPQASTLSLSKLNNVLKSFVGGTCADRVEATWKLVDRDGDGLLDESEMERVAYLVLTPIEKSLQVLFNDSVEAYPVRAPLESLDNDGEQPEPKKGWRARRREKKTEKRLRRIFQDTLKTHFQDEVEMPHRLRCIYAWADKAHQDNKIDSIHVESTDWGSRKRFVELQPKISLPEFQLVQKEHFAHLDRVGQELVKSFRENLLVDQGKGRQSSELKRDCALFLAAVCIVDFIIVSL